MYFGELPVAQCRDCLLAHSVKLNGRRLRKGSRLGAAELAELAAAGWQSLTVARLEEDDRHEDEAAARLGLALAGPGITLGQAATGRINLSAATDGLLAIPRQTIDTLNGIDERIGIATLAEHSRVVAGRLVATIKIIPYAVPESVLARCVAAIDQRIELHPFQPRRTFLIQTCNETSRRSILDKTRRVLGDRLSARQACLTGESRVEHRLECLVAALQDACSDTQQPPPEWLLVSSASAISDRRDLLPLAIEALGGETLRHGMPVDPGNLLLYGQLDGRTVIGVPGCARSAADNGLDRVLDRLAAGLELDHRWLASLGVGGLLEEIADRPRPRRRRDTSTPHVATVLLAAGASRRFGDDNKLLAPCQGIPLLAHAAMNIAASGSEETVVITGAEAARVQAVIARYLSAEQQRSFRHVDNPRAGSGLASSLVLGVSALHDADAVIVCLGDMPAVRADTLQALRKAFREDPTAAMIVPHYQGQPGNPVLIARSLFDSVLRLEGDVGARGLRAANPESTRSLAVDDPGILLDCDTQEALQQAEALLACS